MLKLAGNIQPRRAIMSVAKPTHQSCSPGLLSPPVTIHPAKADGRPSTAGRSLQSIEPLLVYVPLWGFTWPINIHLYFGRTLTDSSAFQTLTTGNNNNNKSPESKV